MCYLKNGFFVMLLSFLLIEKAVTEHDVCIFTKKHFLMVNDSPQYCRLRDNLFDKRLWNYYAGYFCYIYTNPARFIKRFITDKKMVTCDGLKTTIPIAKVKDSLFVTFDYTNLTELGYIKKSFKNDAVFNNYVTCCEEADFCCNTKMKNVTLNSTSTQCPTIWDAWSCFPSTKVNTTAKLPCSSQVYQSPEDVCTLESEKRCSWNKDTQLAEWVQNTDYTVCDLVPVNARRANFHIIFLAICIVFCVPAICIFFTFAKLRKTVRVILHRNLLTAICIRNMFTILSKTLVILDQLKSSAESHHRMEKNSLGCRMLSFLEASSVNAIYACMFLDAFYLHKVIVRAFARETRMAHIYFLLLAMTFTCSICWAIAMAATQTENCWMIDVGGFRWILDGYRIAVLLANTILLADIIRVMILKLKHGSTTKQTVAAFRATIFLTPLFGIHIMVTAKKIVYDNSCTSEDIYNYLRYSMEGLQGIVVSILFCYANSEVRNEVRNGYRKTCIFLNQRFGWNLGGDLLYDRRRATTATFVQEGYQ